MASTASGYEGQHNPSLVDDKELTSVEHDAQGVGQAFIASTYDHNLFDHLQVTKPVEPAGTN